MRFDIFIDFIFQVDITSAGDFIGTIRIPIYFNIIWKLTTEIQALIYWIITTHFKWILLKYIIQERDGFEL